MKPGGGEKRNDIEWEPGARRRAKKSAEAGVKAMGLME